MPRPPPIPGTLLVFAKPPQPGQVKTRLIPALGEEGAAQLHRCLVRQQLATALKAGIAQVQLWCAADTAHPFFQDCQAEFGISLHAQQGDDLGQRQLHALESAMAEATPVVLIGSDIPSMSALHLRQAFAALAADTAAVLTPMEDGGFSLIGLRASAPQLFAGIEWGGERVLAQLRANLEDMGWRYSLLDTLWDVDRPEDLVRLRQAPPATFTPKCRALLAGAEYDSENIDRQQ